MNSSYFFTVILAAVFATGLYGILRIFPVWKVNNLHGLTCNYFTASITGLICGLPVQKKVLHDIYNIMPYAACIGILFIVVFFTAARTAQVSGITVTSVAGKMSMVIPIVAGLLLYDESIGSRKVIGIFIALAAVLLTSLGSGFNYRESRKHVLLPLLLFTGSGMVDTTIKWSQVYWINPENEAFFFSCLFGAAGITGLVISSIRSMSGHPFISLHSLGAGMLLGICNYLSLVFLVHALAMPAAESSLIFSIVNMLVVIFSAVMAKLIFREQITRGQAGGIVLALAAIFILAV